MIPEMFMTFSCDMVDGSVFFMTPNGLGFSRRTCEESINKSGKRFSKNARS
jgi:hypothetical protein